MNSTLPTATPMALAMLAEVSDKPLTEPTWRGSTALNMPLKLGDWNSDQPKPNSISGITTPIWPAGPSSRENPIMLSMVSAEPTVQSMREPSRSASQPPIGARTTMTREKQITVKPTCVGV